MDKKILQISKLSDIPPEIISNIPKILITGNYTLSIENHKGIVFYSENSIIINFKKGKLNIEGNNINIDLINNEVIMLKGNIEQVKFENME